MYARGFRALAVVAALIMCVASTTDAGRGDKHRSRKRTGDELAVADLGWPATTRSARTRHAAKVYAGPAKQGGRIGKVAQGQHLAWTTIIKTRDRCRAWLQIEPRGWMCAKDVEASDDAPALTVVPRAIKTGTELVGIDLTVDAPPSWPFAWALERKPWRRRDQGKPPRPPRPTVVRAAADADAARVRTLEPRTAVAVLETRGGFVRIGTDEWVARRELRLATSHPRPDGVAADERWIDVDLEEQVLVSYLGDTPVYTTLVSSGRRSGTPTGIYRIASKQATATMRDTAEGESRWNHKDVPFIMYFRARYALHGAYWHDRFGNEQSVGCVNLAPEDARWLSAWTLPAIPTGWLQVVADDDAGTVVRIHDADDPDPVWRDYDGETVAP